MRSVAISATAVLICLLLLAGCGSSVTVVDPPTSLARPTPTFDLSRFADIRTIDDFPGGMRGFDTTHNDILITSDELCFLVARAVLGESPSEDSVRLVLNNAPVPLEHIDAASDEDFVEYCFNGVYTQDTYNIEFEIDEIDGRAIYGWKATVTFPLTLPFASFPGSVTEFTPSESNLILEGDTICLEIPTQILHMDGDIPSVEIAIDDQVVEIATSDPEGDTQQYCVDAPDQNGLYRVNVRLLTTGEVIELYRWEFIVNGP